MGKFILDKEIDLNECDYLKTKVYADNLTNVIKNTDKDKVFTIGLFGSWGTGKSSIVKTSKKDFDQTKIKFITYDAWQYVNDSFRRMFLRKLRKDLKYDETDLMKKFYENESTDIGNKYQLSSTRLGFIIGGLVLLLAILTFIPFKLEYKFPIYAIFTLLGLLITIISGAFHQLKISVTKPHIFAPEQFEDCFKQMVSKSLTNYNWIERVKYVICGDETITNLEKLVIVIDNIDRCSSDIAYNLLTDIKTFLSTEPYSIIFVIPVDDAALRKHIFNTNKGSDDCNKDKEEFLRKFFNVTIRIKPYGETDLFTFAKKISENAGLNLKNETINLATKEYSKNPRRIIQLFNNLMADFSLYDDEFVQKNEALICSVIIMREEFNDYYHEVLNCPKSYLQEGKNYIKDRKAELIRFIGIAHNSIGTIDSSALNIILTNSDNLFSHIDSDFKDSIKAFNIAKIKEDLSVSTTDLVDYFIYRMDLAKKNNLLTELSGLFNMICQLSKKHSFEISDNKRFLEKITDNFNKIIFRIEDIKNVEDFVLYARFLSEQKTYDLKQFIINNINADKITDHEEKSFKELFNATLKNFQDKETSKELSASYLKNYKHVDDTIEYSTDQIEYLISNDVVKQRITELPLQEKEIILNTETKEYQKVKWLFSKKTNIDERVYEHFFDYIAKNTRMDGKSIDKIARLLQFVQPCLELIPDRKLATTLKTQTPLFEQQDKVIPNAFYELIVNDRQMGNPQFRMKPNTDQERELYINSNFINECIANNSHIQKIINFVISIYRITSGKINVKTEIAKLLGKYGEQLNIEFVKLINKKYNLHSLLDIIFIKGTNYNNENTITLLKHCFAQKKSDNTYFIEENKAKIKINELLIFAQDQQSEEIFALLESLSTHERYKAMLSDLIVENKETLSEDTKQKIEKIIKQ